MIKEITRPVEEMEQYDYFFRYLPGIATQIENPSEFMDVTKIMCLYVAFVNNGKGSCRIFMLEKRKSSYRCIIYLSNRVMLRLF